MDEKSTTYLTAPHAGGSAGAPPSYGATEGDQPARVVYVQAPRQPGSPAKDYFGLSLFTLLCCFWPLGLIALIKSVEVRRHNDDGMYDDARKASKDARLFNKIGIIIGIITLAISLAMTLLIVIVDLIVILP